jgi:hypothetical protein
LGDNILTPPKPIISSWDKHELDTTPFTLQGLQNTPGYNLGELVPLEDYDPKSYDLVSPTTAKDQPLFSLEKQFLKLFSREHLQIIFADSSLLLEFSAFLNSTRPHSIPMLCYYLDALKALKAIEYVNAITKALSHIAQQNFTAQPTRITDNTSLREKANKAFDVLTDEDLPAYVTFRCIQIVSLSIRKRINGTLAPHLRQASEGKHNINNCFK